MKKQSATHKRKPTRKGKQKISHMPQIGSVDDSRRDPVAADPIGGIQLSRKK